MNTEHELLRRIALKDADALGELYDLCATRVYSVAVAVLGETHAAQEVTQDVFLKVWQQPELFRSDHGSAMGWLLTISRNRAIDRLRAERRGSSHVAASLDDDHARDVPDLADLSDARWRELQSVFDALPTEQREVIVLAYYRDLSQTDIAAHLGIPLGTVKTRMRLGMEKLRHAMNDVR